MCVGGSGPGIPVLRDGVIEVEVASEMTCAMLHPGPRALPATSAASATQEVIKNSGQEKG
jgi:hypothetical protein